MKSRPKPLDASRKALAAGTVLLVTLGGWESYGTEAVLPVGSHPAALDFPHFPNRMHTFVWRNWSVVGLERMAAVLGTSVENVKAVAESMGLPPHRPIPPEQKARGYITVLRRNWHLLPYEQLLAVLDMTADELAYALREDDFLFIKLGRLKPQCDPLRYTAPDEATLERAAEIKQVVQDTFGSAWLEPGQSRFAFIRELSEPMPGRRPPSQKQEPEKKTDRPLRYIYSYFALFGDPLMNPRLDPYPDGLLQRLADLGVTGVWMHTVLRTLAPSETFPEFGRGHETRLATLRKLVQRAKRFGIDIYLYCNEPRAMPASFFKDRESVRGVQEGDHFALCTSTPEVRAWLTDSLEHVFKGVPGLGGVFTITASENLTNCASHRQWKRCPQCRDRDPADIIAEVNTAIETGVHRGSPDAKVIAWDWGWADEWAPGIIAKLPKSIWLQSVSEWSIPIRRGGVDVRVGEYSISVVGPGPRATKHWKLARQAGLKTVAKVQFNNTWELSAVPYLPVLDLVAEHCQNLASLDIDGMMLSWTLGGSPSPNLEVAGHFAENPKADANPVLDRVAEDRFGKAAATHVQEAWTAFSNAFREYPYHGSLLYNGPQQYGPSNLLYAEPTGYSATMIGFPYDALNHWRGAYPPDVFVEQFTKVADGWKKGLGSLRTALQKADTAHRPTVEAELTIAQAAHLHFRTVANQARFVIVRDALLDKKNPLSAEQRRARLDELKAVIADEIDVAHQLYSLVKQDSRIGYEASNHYYYVPLDLAEKVINCRHLLDHVLPRMR